MQECGLSRGKLSMEIPELCPGKMHRHIDWLGMQRWLGHCNIKKPVDKTMLSFQIPRSGLEMLPGRAAHVSGSATCPAVVTKNLAGCYERSSPNSNGWATHPSPQKGLTPW